MRTAKYDVADLEELQKQITTLQQRVSAKTDTIVRLGQDLEKSEAEKKDLLARVATFERNLERSERELFLLTASEQKLKSHYAAELERLTDNANRYKKEADQNRLLVNELQEEKNDLRKDCKTFRQAIARFEVEKIADNESRNGDEPIDTQEIGRHEQLQAKYKQMEADLHTVLGLKEELLIERDELQRKVQRLSSELSYMLNGDPRRVAEDLDSLVTENRYLKAQLNTAQEESESIKSTLAKYRIMANEVNAQQTKSPKAKTTELGGLEEKSSVAVINMKQIRELLASQSIELDDSDYRAITTILLDLCNDKQMALAHLRRANKVLGNRLHEVETKLTQYDSKKNSRSSSPRLDNELVVPNLPRQ